MSAPTGTPAPASDTLPPEAAPSLPHQLLAAAERLLERPATETGGVWPRAAAILTRQALERALADFLTDRAPGSQAASFTTQLLLLRLLHPNPELAARTAYTWSALSSATHHHGYELNPTAAALRAWLTTVSELVHATAWS